MEAGGNGGFPGGFEGLPGAGTAPMSSASNVNTNGVVSVGGAAPPPADAAPAAAGGEPAAKRMKLEPTPAADAAGAGAVANMAAIAANRAAGPAIGSGMSTEQFLQALPAAYAATAPPAYMVMLQQQHQQQQQAHAQAQAQRQQLIQQQQLQLQQHIQAQKQLQLQRHLQAAAGGQFPVAAQQHSPQLQQQYVGQLTPAQAQAHSQAQAIIMAAITKNSVAQWNQLQQQQQQQQQQHPQQQLQMRQVPAVKAEPMPAVRVPAVPLKRPQPTADPVCLVCQQKGDDLFVCDYACGVAAHPRCIGEDMIVALSTGLKICASCSVMQQDRNTKEDLRKGGVVAVSVRRAILCVNVETNAPTNFEKFGHLSSLRLYEISQVAGYPIAPFASRFIEPHLLRWMAEKLVNIASWSISVRDVFTLVIGLYSLDCARISHCWRDKTIEVVRAKNFSTTDYLGWHPSIEGPEVRCSSLCHICAIRNPPELLHCARCRRALAFPTVFTKFTSALLACYYAEHVGIPFGTSFNDVFAHTHTVRSYYKGLKPFDPNGHDWDMFVDQMRMIFGLVDVVSNFGVLELDPDLFDAEVNIIFNQQYLNYAMQMSDFENVGRFLQSMKLFGKQRADQSRSAIEACEKFLMERQQPNGSWCKQGSSVIDQYKSTVACAKALVNPVIRGRGPESSEQRRLLIRWAKKTPGNLHAKRAEQLGQGKLLAAGVTVTGRTVPNQKKLELFYRRQIVPTSGLNSLETLATARLQSIWSTQKPEPQDEDVKDDLVSATTDNEDADAASDKADKSEETLAQEDDSLIKLSLSGELSLFDGLKFEDGDVIDISGNGEALDDERDEETKTEDDEAEANETADDVPAEEDEQEDQVAEDDMYDDDDDAEADAPSQLPEPDMLDQSEEAEGDEIDVNAVDMSILDGDLQLDEAYSQASMDLALDM